MRRLRRPSAVRHRRREGELNVDVVHLPVSKGDVEVDGQDNTLVDADTLSRGTNAAQGSSSTRCTNRLVSASP